MKQSKFEPLGRYLENSGQYSICLSFEKIESLIQEKLCSSAYKYRPYWSPSSAHTCALVIQEAGYQVETVDFQGKTVSFVKGTK